MFAGRWRVVSGPDLSDDYLRLGGEAYVKLRQRGRCVEGEYRIGLSSGEIDGRLHGDQVIFSFAGMDEMDEVHGAGIARLSGDRLALTFNYHMGDEFTFECERSPR